MKNKTSICNNLVEYYRGYQAGAEPYDLYLMPEVYQSLEAQITQQMKRQAIEDVKDFTIRGFNNPLDFEVAKHRQEDEHYNTKVIVVYNLCKKWDKDYMYTPEVLRDVLMK